jgi:hypothetical protein
MRRRANASWRATSARSSRSSSSRASAGKCAGSVVTQAAMRSWRQRSSRACSCALSLRRRFFLWCLPTGGSSRAGASSTASPGMAAARVGMVEKEEANATLSTVLTLSECVVQCLKHAIHIRLRLLQRIERYCRACKTSRYISTTVQEASFDIPTGIRASRSSASSGRVG